MTTFGTVDQVLAAARSAGLDRLDAQLLLGRVLARPRTWLLAHGDAAVDPKSSEAFDTLVARRAGGEPVAYLVGEKAFHGLQLRVDRRVLVPRPDTEVLVDWAIELLSGTAGRTVLDLGTGSGAVALAVKNACPGASVTATDVSEEALAVARENAARLGLDVRMLQCAWWQGLEGRRFDLVLSNPPYIAADDPHLAALGHEPALALTPGGDGLGAIREIAAGAGARLQPGGWLLLEHGFDQAAAVQALLADHGLTRIQTRLDFGGHSRCTGGQVQPTES